ncbi:MAG: transposase [Alphaproteobacteria bacterium]|nr:transposase [Alphaproteobacteria bacterium]
MMGRQTADQARLFYSFNLDERIPAGHLLRRIDVFVRQALADIHGELAPFYSHTGRPSIDPELMMRMLVVGYCYGIRSERRLCEEVSLNLAYRWFCRLDFEDGVPDHSTFSKNRHGRFRESALLRHVFERVVGLCLSTGLIAAEGFAVDASVIEADASRYHGLAPDEIDWSKVEKPSRAVREYLHALDEAGELEPGRKPPKVISPSDPASAWTAKANKRVQFGYGLNYLIDNAHAVIVEVEATPARTYDEVASTKLMIERAKRRFNLKPRLLAADSAYGTGKFLAWLIDKKIAPHVVVRDLSNRKDGTFSRADFKYDADKDTYTCPTGKTLTTTGRIHDGKTILYRARKNDCQSCPLKPKCCPKAPERKVPRDVNEAARDVARSLVGTADFERSRDERKKVEMRFAHLKTHHGFERMRLRGISGARDEFHLAAIVQNLKTMALRLTKPPTAVQVSA